MSLPQTTCSSAWRRLTRAGKRKDLAVLTAMGANPSEWTTRQWSQYNKLTVGFDPLTLDTVKKVVLGSLLTSPCSPCARSSAP